LSQFASPKAALVCLDLQRNRQVGETCAPVVSQCRRVLAEARRRRWPVLHVHARSLADPRPIAGLEPRPSEAVFLRHGPSAFSNANFARAAMALGGPFALIGFALEDTVLATAFAAADRDLAVDVILDAVFAGAHEPEAVDRALLAPLRALAPRIRVVASDDLLLADSGRFAAANLP
jgi:nicotinamidase-related amidase